MIFFFFRQSYQQSLTRKILKKKKQEIKKQQDKERNDEIDVQMLHDEINSGEIPKETEFYFGCPNQNYF